MGKRFTEYSQFDLSQVNKDVLKKWDENQVFAKSMTERDGCQIAYNRQSVFGRFIISMYDLPDDSGSRAKQCNAYHTE